MNRADARRLLRRDNGFMVLTLNPSTFDDNAEVMWLHVMDSAGYDHLSTLIKPVASIHPDALDFAEIDAMPFEVAESFAAFYDQLYILLKNRPVVTVDLPMVAQAFANASRAVGKPSIMDTVQGVEWLDVLPLLQELDSIPLHNFQEFASLAPALGVDVDANVAPHAALGVLAIIRRAVSAPVLGGSLMCKSFGVSRKFTFGGLTMNLVNRAGASEPMMRETLRHYVAMTNLLKAGVRKVETPELLARSDWGAMPDDEPRVQIYGPALVKLNDLMVEVNINIFHEATLVQDVLDGIWLNLDVSYIAPSANPPQAPQQPAAAPPAAPPAAPQPPTAPPSGNIMVATRAPNPRKPQYPHGQRVVYDLNKIEIGTKNGAVLWNLWGPLGRQYPLAVLYADNTHHMDAAGEFLKGLNLGLQNPQAMGQWQMVAVATHVPQADQTLKEFMNVVEIKGVAAAQPQPTGGSSVPAW